MDHTGVDLMNYQLKVFEILAGWNAHILKVFLLTFTKPRYTPMTPPKIGISTEITMAQKNFTPMYSFFQLDL